MKQFEDDFGVDEDDWNDSTLDDFDDDFDDWDDCGDYIDDGFDAWGNPEHD